MSHLWPWISKCSETELPYKNESSDSAGVRAQYRESDEILVRRLFTKFLRSESLEDARGDAFRASGNLLRTDPDYIDIGERREDVRLRSLPS